MPTPRRRILPIEHQPKDYELHVRIDATFKGVVEALAWEKGLTVSMYIRTLIVRDAERRGYTFTAPNRPPYSE